MCGQPFGKAGKVEETTAPKRPGVQPKWSRESAGQPTGVDRGRPDLTPHPVPIPAPLRVSQEDEHLAAAGHRYARLQSSKRAYLLCQVAFTALLFGYLIYQNHSLQDVFSLLGWIALAIVTLFGIRWALDADRDRVQLGCLWITAALIVCWFVGLSLLDLHSVIPNTPLMPERLPVKAITPAVPPETWYACGVQGILAVWLVLVLAWDVRSRRLLKD